MDCEVNTIRATAYFTHFFTTSLDKQALGSCCSIQASLVTVPKMRCSCRSLKSRLTLPANSSTKSNQPLIISGWEVFALFLLNVEAYVHSSKANVSRNISTSLAQEFWHTLQLHFSRRLRCRPYFPAFSFWTWCTCTTPLICEWTNNSTGVRYFGVVWPLPKAVYRGV